MRKITIASIGPIGCAPSILVTRSVYGNCIDYINGYARNFNAALKPMLEQLQPQLPGSTLVYIDAYTIVMNILQNPLQYGINPIYTPPSFHLMCSSSYLSFFPHGSTGQHYSWYSWYSSCSRRTLHRTLS